MKIYRFDKKKQALRMELMYAFGLRTTFKNQILNKFPDMYIPIRLLFTTMIIRQPVPLLISKKMCFLAENCM